MKIIVEDVFHFQEIAAPEKVLWLAVIERAMLDAIYPTQELGIKHKMNLQQFFHEQEPKPFNLIYICNNLFDYPDAAVVIRKRLKELEANKCQLSFRRCRAFKGYY